MNIDEELSKVGLTRKQYENAMSDIIDKINGEKDIDWSEIHDKYNLRGSTDFFRQAASRRPFGGAFVYEYFVKNKTLKDHSSDIDNKLDEIKREKIKLQTLNVERNRLDRRDAKQQLYFEYIGSVCEQLELPDFQPLFIQSPNNPISYICTLSDIHYGASFKSQNNEYNREIARERLELLCSLLYDFVEKHEVNTLYILELGDSIQGLLRLSDLNLNDTSVVKAVVEISRLLAQFLNQLSAFVNIEYYHAPTANHTQLRVLNAKASELAAEDVEYIIGNYIKDLCSNNSRINVHLAEEGKEYITVDIPFGNIYAMHGHQIKNIENSIRDLSMLVGEHIPYLLLGHYHNGREIPSYESVTYDAEVLVSPSFIGSDPYSDRLMKGCKPAVKIYGFDDVYGHTESYKILL